MECDLIWSEFYMHGCTNTKLGQCNMHKSNKQSHFHSNCSPEFLQALPRKEHWRVGLDINRNLTCQLPGPVIFHCTIVR